MKELPKQFDFKEEAKIYELWEESGFFNPDNLEGEPYSIMMPPPNVTGVLHLGHALENTLMDVMARYQRMQGKKVLLLPGTDHAAVATQAKVEKVLAGKGMAHPREELGREKLLEEIRTYAENSKATILKQIRQMGTSCDWSRLAYTFDEKRSLAVNETFKKMYDDGLIYRGFKVVNWSVKGQSTCSDDELEYIERQAKFYTFKYSKDFPITISTTRPETKLGDTAVAVNPKDERYQKYIGQIFKVEVGAKNPLEIKIIADENVEMDFGTGALGVTPAHSAIDFEMYEKQKAKQDPIGFVQVIGIDGKMTEEAGKEYVGLDVLAAREKFVAYLEKNNLLEKVEEVSQNVGTSDRFGDVVEALPMTQWFVDVNKKIPGKNKSLKDLMREAVSGNGGEIKINPERFERIYLNWIDNLRDWCISRQIWWGHRIPVWYRNEEIYVGIEAPEGDGWTQDKDTLDTWFSSGLWTFSTLGWPEKTADLKNFHPTSWMQMGHEILFFWMARMILMSTYLLNEIPFKDVYIHGMLRDEKNKKFSKSSGNNIEPLEVADKYGTDALRLSLISGITPGQDSKFYYEKVEGARNFVTKLWNITLYANNADPKFKLENSLETSNLKSSADNWICNGLEKLIQEASVDFENYRFSLAQEKIRAFTWDDLADWYLEIHKIEKNSKVLGYVLNQILKLWHPFTPFVTEKIWDNFSQEKLLMVEKWPEAKKELLDKKSAAEFENLKNIISKIRNLRSIYHIEPAKIIEAYGENNPIISKLARLNFVGETHSTSSGQAEKKLVNILVGGMSIGLDISNLIDVKKELDNIQKEVAILENSARKNEAMLQNENFVNNAKPEVIEETKKRIEEYKTKIKELRDSEIELARL